MPIVLTTSPTDRMVIIVATGALTLHDLADCFRQMLEAHLLSYRKIFVVSAATPMLSDEEMDVFGGLLRRASASGPRGAFAIVADSNRAEFAQRYAAMSGADRPIKVFSSIHEARAWLNEENISPLKP